MSNRQYFKNFIIKQRIFATLCLVLIINETAFSSVLVFTNANSSYSQSSAPLSEEADSMVDLYTGDFHYSVPLLSVPGPNGENVPIVANYNAGIKMNQKASWLGLGWDYNPGEISRSVVGAPDDYSGQPIAQVNNLWAAKFEKVNYTFGPFNYEKINGFVANPLYWNDPKYNGLRYFASDVITIPTAFKDPNNLNKPVMSSAGDWYPYKRMNVTNSYYKSPAYDQYFVSGNGLNGKLQPYIFEGIQLFNNFTTSQTNSFINYTSNKKRTQFYFENSTYKSLSNTSNDPINNRIKSGYFIKYFTNAEINTPSNLYDTIAQKGFLDYRNYTGSPSNRRDATNFDANGIGGIQITTPNGLTYHYSLPVYTKEQLSKTFQSNDVKLTSSANIASMRCVYTPEKYAISWKLTAITGIDYIDRNNNKLVDIG
ncbi:MAG: hypothetical protein ACK5ZT_01200, partial [Sphingobacteriaceae bacterium]